MSLWVEDRRIEGFEGGRGAREPWVDVEVDKGDSSNSLSVTDRWTWVMSSSSSKSINLPMAGWEGAVLKLLADRVCCRGGRLGRSSKSLRAALAPLEVVPELYASVDGGPFLLFSPLIDESKKPWGVVVVTSRMKTPSMRPGLAWTRSV